MEKIKKILLLNCTSCLCAVGWVWLCVWRWPQDHCKGHKGQGVSNQSQESTAAAGVSMLAIVHLMLFIYLCLNSYLWERCVLCCLDIVNQCSRGILIHFLLTVLKVREDQEKRRLEEEQQSQLPPVQQPGQQSSPEVPQSQPVPQPVSYVPPQPNQHGIQMSAQPASQQSLQGSNYSTPQSTQLTGMAQGVPYVPHSTGQVPVQGQSVATIQPESEELETDQHQQLQHTGGGVYQRFFYSQIHQQPTKW